MNGRLAALLTAVHAPAWRRRYGTEFCALLADLPATPSVVANASASAFSSQGPAIATIGAFALAAAILAFGPVASDRRTATAQIPAHAVRAGLSRSASVSCTGKLAENAARSAQC